MSEHKIPKGGERRIRYLRAVRYYHGMPQSKLPVPDQPCSLCLDAIRRTRPTPSRTTRSTKERK